MSENELLNSGLIEVFRDGKVVLKETGRELTPMNNGNGYLRIYIPVKSIKTTNIPNTGYAKTIVYPNNENGVIGNIYRYCNSNGISIREFEKRCGLSNGIVKKWLPKGNPSISTLMKIANATGIPIEKWIE